MAQASGGCVHMSLGRRKPIVEANVSVLKGYLLNNQHAPEICEIRVEILGFSQGWM
jgi:hypothetical protein